MLRARYREKAAQGAPAPTRWCAWVRRNRSPTGTSVILLDFDIVMHRLDVFGFTRNGRGLVCRFLGSGAAGQPYDSILVRVDMNASQAGYMLGSELGLDCRCDGRILHEGHRV